MRMMRRRWMGRRPLSAFLLFFLGLEPESRVFWFCIYVFCLWTTLSPYNPNVL